MKLNNWHKAGIGLSIAWLIAAGFLERWDTRGGAQMMSGAVHLMRVEEEEANARIGQRTPDFAACDADRRANFAAGSRPEWQIFALIAALPIMAGWILGYSIFWLRGLRRRRNS